MVAYRRVTDSDVRAIRVASAVGASNTAIAAEVGCTETTVRYWLKNRAPRQPNTPPQCTTAHRKAVQARREIIAKLAKVTVTVKNRTRKLYPSTGCMRTALKREHDIAVCKKTIEGDLKAMGFKCFQRKATTHKSPEDLRRRTLFARKWRAKNTSNWVFTDEKTFTCGDYSSGTEWAEHRDKVTGTDASNCCMDTVYVWGAIGVGFRHLVIIRKTEAAGHATRKRNGEPRKPSECFTSETYIRRCLAPIRKHLEANECLLQADNHRSHTAGNTQRYFEDHGIAWSRDWPARSPDLNPIENLWAYLQRRVSERVPTNAKELANAIKKEWDALDQDSVDKYVLSFKGKCKRVASSGGKPA